MSLAVIGATSAIAQQTTKVFSEAGHDLFLVARDIQHLNEIEKEFFPTDIAVNTLQADISEVGVIPMVAEEIIRSFGEEPYVLVAVGSISGEKEAKSSAEHALQLIDINFRNIVALITPIAQALEQKGKGCLIIISSVSGDRGRQSNFIYGSAKAGLSAYAQGLRSLLYSSGVHVMTVKPGYVDTPMLRLALGQKYDSIPVFLIGSSEAVGRRIYKAAVQRTNVLYVPPIWRSLMFLVKSIPENIFKRTNL